MDDFTFEPGLKGGPWSMADGSMAGPWTWDQVKKRGRFTNFRKEPGTVLTVVLGTDGGRPFAGEKIVFLTGGEWEVTT